MRECPDLESLVVRQGEELVSHLEGASRGAGGNLRRVKLDGIVSDPTNLLRCACPSNASTIV